MALPSLYNPLGRPSGNGFFKIFVVFGIIVISGALLLFAFSNTVNNVSGRSHNIAQREADKYLRGANVDATAMCVGYDSDGDGYVSCPYITKDGATHPLECAGAMNFNTGCRPPKAVLTIPNGFPGR